MPNLSSGSGSVSLQSFGITSGIQAGVVYGNNRVPITTGSGNLGPISLTDVNKLRSLPVTFGSVLTYNSLVNAKTVPFVTAAPGPSDILSYQNQWKLTSAPGPDWVNKYNTILHGDLNKDGTDNKFNVNVDGSGVKYNLPPHKFSLPVRPVSVVSDASNPSNTNGTEIASTEIDQWERRGKMWTYYGMRYNSTTTMYGSDNWTWGFQFMWNPTDININVRRNVNITPSPADQLTSLSGTFQGQESIAFTVILDRTNDFAALRAGNATPANEYPASNPKDASLPIETRVEELLRRGTDHDVDYLFKMINSDRGTSYVNNQEVPNTTWKNGLGRESADTAYLATTIVAVSFGKDPTQNLSYIGWIDSINIKHTAFTEDMIPIRTQLDINMISFANHAI